MSKIIIEFTHDEVSQVVQDLQSLATVQTIQQIEERVAKQFSERIENLKQQVEDAGKPKPKPIGSKKWSLKYESCILCHQADSPHASKGRCGRCYQKIMKNNRAKVAIPLDVRSDGVDTRPDKPRR